MTAPRRLLITAGPSHEPIDAVRYLANRSSGRMGIAITEAAAQRGFATTLLLGPTHLQPPNTSQTTLVRFQSTADLQRLLKAHWPRHDVLIMAAAVADYRPIQSDAAIASKLRRTDQPLNLQLEPTPDLLAELATNTRPDQLVIGFALEPADRLEASAREKLKRKKLDAIVANPLETMDATQITAVLIQRDGTVLKPAPAISKDEFANWLLDVVVAMSPRQ